LSAAARRPRTIGHWRGIRRASDPKPTRTRCCANRWPSFPPLLLQALAAAWYVLAQLSAAVRRDARSRPRRPRAGAGATPADVTHIQCRQCRRCRVSIGWVPAQERGGQLEFNRRRMRGELSELLGPATLETDKLLRTIGIARAAQAQWERLPDDAKQQLKAYADGINAFHAEGGQALPPEFHILRTSPGRWQPQDSVAWTLMMALDLGGNWGNEFARLSALQRLDTKALWQLLPPYPGERPATAVDLAALYCGLGLSQGRRAGAHLGHAPPAAAPVLADAAAITTGRATWAIRWARGPTTGCWRAAAPNRASRCWPTTRTSGSGRRQSGTSRACRRRRRRAASRWT